MQRQSPITLHDDSQSWQDTHCMACVCNLPCDLSWQMGRGIRGPAFASSPQPSPPEGRTSTSDKKMIFLIMTPGCMAKTLLPSALLLWLHTLYYAEPAPVMQDFLQGVDVQLHDHMRRGPSLAAVDVALGPPPQTLEASSSLLPCHHDDLLICT